MIGKLLVNAITDEPANSDVDVGLAHRLAVMHDTAKQACEHEADCDLGIDAGPTIVEAIQVGDFIPQPQKVETRSTRTSTWSSGMSCRSEPVMSGSS